MQPCCDGKKGTPHLMTHRAVMRSHYTKSECYGRLRQNGIVVLAYRPRLAGHGPSVAGGLDPENWDFPPKPKWMRQKTYERCEARFEGLCRLHGLHLRNRPAD